MIIGLAVIMLLTLSQSQVNQDSGYRDPLAASDNGRQTAISSDDDSTKTIAHQGRILSRRNTRLNTRITTSKLAIIGRTSGASLRDGENGQNRQRTTIP